MKMNNWIPVTDGIIHEQRFLILIDNCGEKFIDFGVYHGKQKEEMASHEYDEQATHVECIDNIWYLKEGWYRCYTELDGTEWNCFIEEPVKVTHYQPVPALPKEAYDV